MSATVARGCCATHRPLTVALVVLASKQRLVDALLGLLMSLLVGFLCLIQIHLQIVLQFVIGRRRRVADRARRGRHGAARCDVCGVDSSFDGPSRVEMSEMGWSKREGRPCKSTGRLQLDANSTTSTARGHELAAPWTDDSHDTLPACSDLL